MFEVEAADLARIIQIASIGIPTRPTAVEESWARLTFKNGQVTATCSSTTLSASATCSMTGEGESEFLIVPKQILPFLEYAGGTIQVKPAGGSIRLLGEGTSIDNLPTADADEFIPVDAGPTQKSFVLTKQDIAGLLSSANLHDSREICKCISVTSNKDRVCCITHTLALTIVFTTGDPGISALIPIADLQKAAKAVGRDPIQISLTGSKVIVESDDTRVVFLSANGDPFAETKHVSIEPKYTLLFEHKQAKSVLTLAMEYCSDSVACDLEYNGSLSTMFRPLGFERFIPRPVTTAVRGNYEPFSEIFSIKYLLAAITNLGPGCHADFADVPDAENTLWIHLHDPNNRIHHIFMPRRVKGDQ